MNLIYFLMLYKWKISKLEILYNVISDTVGRIKGVTKIEGAIDFDYVIQDFIQNRTSHYLLYNFRG